MNNKTDIQTIDHIKTLVNTFYEKVREDDLIGPIFNGIIQDRWPIHLEKMYRFWQTVLLGDQTYHGSPFTPHAELPVKKQHFDRWKKLFVETIDDNFTGEKAEEAKWRADRMAELFLSKLTYYQERDSKPLF